MKQFSIKIFIALLALAGVIAVASAQIAPGTFPPSGAVTFPPINTSNVDQTKLGGITAKFFVGKQGLFRDGNCSSLWCGFMFLDLLNALKLTPPDGSSGTGIRVDAGGNFYIYDGNQAAGKVLTSDASGKATWGTMNNNLACAITATPFQVTSFPQSVVLSWSIVGQGQININNGVGTLSGTYNSATNSTSGTTTVTVSQPTSFTGAASGASVPPQATCTVSISATTILPNGTKLGDVLHWNNGAWRVNTDVGIFTTTGVGGNPGRGLLKTDLLRVADGASGSSVSSPKVLITTNPNGTTEWKQTTPIYRVTNERCNTGTLTTDSTCATRQCGTYQGTNTTYTGRPMYFRCDSPLTYCPTTSTNLAIITGSISPDGCANGQPIGRLIQ